MPFSLFLPLPLLLDFVKTFPEIIALLPLLLGVPSRVSSGGVVYAVYAVFAVVDVFTVVAVLAVVAVSSV